MSWRWSVLAAMVLTTAFGLRAASTQTPVPPRTPLAKLPRTLGGWTVARQETLDADTAAELRADDYLSRVYVRGDGSVADLFVGYYETQQKGATIHSPMNCLPSSGWQVQSMGRAAIEAAPADVIDVNRDIVQNGLDTRLVLYWYRSHGRAIASEYAAKVYLVLDGLRLHRTDGALIRVITPLGNDEPKALAAASDFVRALYPRLAAHLPD